MESIVAALASCPLFSGIAPEELSALLHCLAPLRRHAARQEPILLEGEAPKGIGVVLSGAVQILRTDYAGNRSIVAHIPAGGLFGEAFACAGISAMPVSVVAAEDSMLLILDCTRLLHSCSSTCAFHQRLIDNLLRLLAVKNLSLNRRLEIASQRTTREKLLTYLRQEARRTGSRTVVIPYDRQELADFLGVDRSGLSTEIGRLCKAGILACSRSTFTLLTLPETESCFEKNFSEK